MIISASRRCDIPAFYSEWFINRVMQERVSVKNPFNPNQIKNISLKHTDVDCIVFWTKNAEPLIDKLKILDDKGYFYYFMFTITPYGKDMEPNLPGKEDIIHNFIKLSKKIGPARVILRYDPIIINNKYSVNFHIKSFKSLIANLNGYTRKCIISFIDIYNKLPRSAKEIIGGPVDKNIMKYLVEKLNAIAKSNNIVIQTCCEEIDISSSGIIKGACIDKEFIEQSLGRKLDIKKAKSQRELCNCAQSVDIGAYNSCAHECIYCYANAGHKNVRENIKKHDITSPFLIG